MKISQISKKYKIGNFIDNVKSDLASHNGKLILKKRTYKNSKFDGEFLESDMVIKCFVDFSSTYWIGVLAHEYCHFLQCINNNKLWLNFQDSVFENSDDLESIFQKKTNVMSKKLRKKISRHIINMELDCDKQAIKLINKYKLPVNKKEYITKANVILYKYLFWGEYGIWPDFIDKKTGKTANYKKIGATRLLCQTKYKHIDQIPKKLFYIFQKS
jgi:hypothetical protein